MSRIGRKPIPIPSGVEVEISNGRISAKGPKGSEELSIPAGITVRKEENQLVVSRKDDSRQQKSLHGLMRALINNLVEGVSKGFRKELEIRGTGYSVKLQHGGLLINIGYSHPVFIGPVEGIDYEVQGNTNLAVVGTNKQIVGAVAAKIRSVRPPEPYKGKGIRYKGEHVRRKAGKTVGK